MRAADPNDKRIMTQISNELYDSKCKKPGALQISEDLARRNIDRYTRDLQHLEKVVAIRLDQAHALPSPKKSESQTLQAQQRDIDVDKEHNDLTECSYDSSTAETDSD